MNKKLIFLLILLFALQVSFAQNPIFKETKLFTLNNGEKVLQGNVYENGSWYLITEKGDKQSLIINGKREGWFKKVYRVEFTEDGKRYAYIVQKELSEEEIDPLNPFKKGKFYVVIDGVKGEEFDYIIENSFIMTSDGKVAYIASNNGWWNKDKKYVEGKWYVVFDGKKGEEFDYIYGYSLTFTSDGKVAYIASKGGGWDYDEDYYYSGGKYFIVFDNQESKPYDVFYSFKYLKEKDTFIALAKDCNDILLIEYVNTK